MNGMMSLKLTTPYGEIVIRRNGWVFGKVSFDCAALEGDRIRAILACQWALDHRWVEYLLGTLEIGPEVDALIAEVASHPSAD